MKTIKFILSISLLSLVTTMAQAQNLSFFSRGFEEGVKLHLGLDSTAVVTQQQTDTITSINLSGFDIKDIRDVVYLPQVKMLDLSYNSIWDIEPVLSLDSLRFLDLRSNKIENIDMLANVLPDSMTVNVAYNYIQDYSRLLLPTHCKLSLIGLSAQIDRVAPFVDVYQLFVEPQGRTQQAYYHGYTNQDQVFLEYDNKRLPAVLDGNLQIKALSGITSTTMVKVTNGQLGDSTWVVPIKNLKAGDNELVVFDTELPDDYVIAFANALHGDVEIIGKELHYLSPSQHVADVITFNYFQWPALRGTGSVYINSPTCDVNCDGVVTAYDITAIYNYLLNNDTTFLSTSDVTGDGLVTAADVTAVYTNLLTTKKRTRKE